MHLEPLQLAVNAAVDAINARGSLINARLHDVPAHVREIALHGFRHGAAVALTAAQVQTGYKFHECFYSDSHHLYFDSLL